MVSWRSQLDFYDKTYDSSYVTKYPHSKRNHATRLRQSGHSLGEISSKLNIAKSTASLWLQDISLNQLAHARIEKRRSMARLRAAQTNRERYKSILVEIERRSYATLSIFNLKDPNLCKTLCAFLYWGEGAKADSQVSFVNSDPKMIFSFLYLLRSSFNLDETKFRVLVHIHEYHNNHQIKTFWSKVSNIPLTQFSKSYLKPHTAKTIRPGFKGTVRISYYDTKIAHELKAIYNTLARLIGA